MSAPGAESATVGQGADYAVLGCMLAASAAIGVATGILDCVRRNKNKGEEEEESTIKKRNLSVFPAALSVIASSSAAPFVLGVPAEMYYFGTEFALFIFGAIVAVPLITHGILVRLHNLECTNMYEYLEMRYNKVVRSIASLAFAITIIIYVGVITYSPAISLSQISGLKVEVAIAITGAIAIVYTTVGGLKGLVWVDAAQMLLLLASILAIIIQGTIEVGSASKVWDLSQQGHRVEFNQLSANPLVRTTLWTQLIGGAFLVLVLYSLQNTAQKFLALPTLPKLYVTAYFSIFAKVTYLLLLSYEGLVIYAFFVDCSPILTGAVKTSDQLVPYFVLLIFRKIPGMTGLFLAALFSACLSTIAAGLNSLAAVAVMDIILPAYKKRKGTAMNAGLTTLIFKVAVVLFGILTTGLGFVTPMLGTGVLQIVLNLASVVGGPLLGSFITGIFMPWTNSWGAGVGLVVSLVFAIWMAVGGIMLEGKYHLLQTHYLKPLSGAMCPHPTPGNVTVDYATDIMSSTLAWTTSALSGNETGNGTSMMPPAASPTPQGIEKLYQVSYMWYSLIAVLVFVFVANVVSLITGLRRGAPVNTTLGFSCCYNKTTEEENSSEIVCTKISSLGEHSENYPASETPPPPYENSTSAQPYANGQATEYGSAYTNQGYNERKES